MVRMSIEEFSARVNDIMPEIVREFTKDYGKEIYKLKMTPPQFITLDLLNKHGESKMTDLAHYINVTTAAMTGVVDRLVRDGYVSRNSDPEDRRIIKVALTAKGNRVVKDIVERRKAMTMKMFSLISQEEREKYLDILLHLKEHISNN
jgi:DNA-binding MarR family transcriptional regulator